MTQCKSYLPVTEWHQAPGRARYWQWHSQSGPCHCNDATRSGHDSRSRGEVWNGPGPTTDSEDGHESLRVTRVATVPAGLEPLGAAEPRRPNRTAAGPGPGPQPGLSRRDRSQACLPTPRSTCNEWHCGRLVAQPEGMDTTTRSKGTCSSYLDSGSGSAVTWRPWLAEWSRLVPGETGHQSCCQMIT